MNRIPKPYDGPDGYIFISYSHRDTDRVFPIVQRLIDEGYRVWLDVGIDPGTEWDENIALHIKDCGYYLAFVSESFIASGNCKDELTFARDLEKDRLVVYLEDVELPYGIAMRVSRIQSIFKFKYDSADDFYEKLFSANNLCKFKNERSEDSVSAADEISNTEKKPEIKSTKSPTKLFTVISIVSTVLCGLCILWLVISGEIAMNYVAVCAIALASIAVAFGILAMYGLEKKSYWLLLIVFFMLPLALGLIPVFFIFGVAGLAFAIVLAIPAAIIILMNKERSPADGRRNGKK